MTESTGDRLEQLLLAALLTDNKRLADVGNLKPEHFTWDRHRKLFAEIQFAISQGVPATPKTFYRLNGEAPYVAELAASAVTTTPHAVAVWAKELKALHYQKQMLALANDVERVFTAAKEEHSYVPRLEAVFREFTDLSEAWQQEIPTAPQGGLPIRAFDEIIYDPSADVWLIEDLLLTEEISLIFGPPNVGKTFFALNASLAVADRNAITWFGRKLTHGNVAYIASEGGKRIDKRIAAWKSYHLYDRWTKLPFWLISEPVDLCHGEEDLRRVVAAIRSVCREPLALLTIETVNSVLAGGDENNPVDMGRLIANARRLRDEFDCHVMLIHHPPHGRETARGHTSLPAAVDTEMLLTEEEKHTKVSMKKQREAEKAEPFSFALKVIQLGDNRDEKPISSCVVEPI